MDLKTPDVNPTVCMWRGMGVPGQEVSVTAQRARATWLSNSLWEQRLPAGLGDPGWLPTLQLPALAISLLWIRALLLLAWTLLDWFCW